MDSPSTSDKLQQLRVPFPRAEIKWRAGRTNSDKTRAYALPYIEARAVVDRLDEVMGPSNWKTEFRTGPSGGVICSLALRVDGEWIAKENGADNTDLEAVKGGLSDSLKRAATMWGIGRYLYRYVAEIVQIDKHGRLEYHPPLPDEFLPESERGQNLGATTLNQPSLGAEAGNAVPAGDTAGQESAPSSTDASTEAAAETAASAPETAAAVAAEEPAAAPAVAEQTVEPAPSASAPAQPEVKPESKDSAPAAAASTANTDDSTAEEPIPDGLTADEQKRVEGLLARLDKGIAVSIIRDYVNDKGKQSMGEAARAFVLRRLERHEKAAA